MIDGVVGHGSSCPLTLCDTLTASRCSFLSFSFHQLCCILLLHLQSLSHPDCEYKMVNESRMVVCDLGNPMVAGTEVSCRTHRHQQHNTLMFYVTLLRQTSCSGRQLFEYIGVKVPSSLETRPKLFFFSVSTKGDLNMRVKLARQ